jgi:hypothetical protein
MIRIDLQGSKREVKSFLHVLGRMPQFRVVRERRIHSFAQNMNWIGDVEYQPFQRIRAVCLQTKSGKSVYLPMADIIRTEVRPGVHIVTGTVCDVSELPRLPK